MQGAHLEIYIHHALRHPSFWRKVHLQLEAHPLVEVIPAAIDYTDWMDSSAMQGARCMCILVIEPMMHQCRYRWSYDVELT